MLKTILQIRNGNLDPMQHLGEGNAEMKYMEDLIYRNYLKLEEALNEKEKEIFKKYNDYLTKYVIMSNEESFGDGFCLGARIIAEALTGAEKML